MSVPVWIYTSQPPSLLLPLPPSGAQGPMGAPAEDLSIVNWTTERIREATQRRFQKRPCWYQVEVAKAVHAGKDVLGCAPTGAGKTLSFWIPLVMAIEDGEDKVLFVISPLNVLAKQNVSTLTSVGIPAIAVTAENAHPGTFVMDLILSRINSIFSLLLRSVILFLFIGTPHPHACLASICQDYSCMCFTYS
jgi:hypothetical protein